MNRRFSPKPTKAQNRVAVLSLIKMTGRPDKLNAETLASRAGMPLAEIERLIGERMVAEQARRAG